LSSAKQVKRVVDGILLVNKPQDLSSNFVLQKIKYKFRACKAGHTGTLDPLATGLMIICFGQATKFANFLLDADKAYRATAKLGITTTTGDITGDVLTTSESTDISCSNLINTLSSFIGKIEQVPPMYSALKHKGQPLYKLARQGINLKRNSRSICIHNLSLQSATKDTFTFDVHCSKGTYVRTLVEDIGAKLGCGATLTALQRTVQDEFSLEDAIDFDTLMSLNETTDLDKLLLPIDRTIQKIPKMNLTTEDCSNLMQGKIILLPNSHSLATQNLVRVHNSDNKFIGVCEVTNGQVKAKRLIAQ